jgi:hypothetical protein
MLNLDFADDIAFLSDHITGAQDLLRKVETGCGKTGLHLNAKNTEYKAFNVNTQDPLLACNGDRLKQVAGFKYL